MIQTENVNKKESSQNNAEAGLAFNVIFVNNDYEKISRQKQEVIEHNANATKTNKAIARSKRRNALFTLFFASLLSFGLGVYLWFNFNVFIANCSLFTSKCIIVGIVTSLVFLVSEAASYVYRIGLDKKKGTVRTVSEAMSFITFMHGKTLKDYSIAAYEEIPYKTQRVGFTVYVEDEAGLSLEYISSEKWSLVLLPVLFDVLVDAENTTIYMPCKENSVALKVRERAEEELAKDQLTEAMIKKSEEELAKAQKEIDSARKQSEVIIAELKVDLDNAKQENIRVKADAEDTERALTEVNAENARLKTEVEMLKQDVIKHAERTLACESELQSVMTDYKQEKEKNENLIHEIEFSKTEQENFAKTIKEINQRYEDEISSLKTKDLSTKHESEAAFVGLKEELKKAMTDLQAQKDANHELMREKLKYETENRHLKNKIANENNVNKVKSQAESRPEETNDKKRSARRLTIE